MKHQLFFVLLGAACAVGTNASAQESSPPPSIREFVRAVPIHGISYSEVSALYDPSVTPELIALLDSPSEEAQWAKIAGLLGIVGDERATRALIAFVEKPGSHPLSREHDTARKEAIRALGFLVNRTGNEEALAYLLDSLTPTVWRQRNVEGVSPWMTSYTEYDLALCKFAVFGLALSGNARAGDALRSLQQSPTPQQAMFRSGLDDILSQWLEVHQLVAERGVTGMYDYYAEKGRLDDARATERVAR